MEKTAQKIVISRPNLKTALITIVGDAPLVEHKFSAKAREQMKLKQEGGSTYKAPPRSAKDFMVKWEEAKHISQDYQATKEVDADGKTIGFTRTAGWYGLPAPALRAAMVSACRMANVKMTQAKLALKIEADGVDKDDFTPLVRITKGEPVYHEACVRNETGVVDIRGRPMWLPGWEADVRITFDSDYFSLESVAALLERAGQQVGIGEGRNDSKDSCGIGWGSFTCKQEVAHD